MLVDLSSEVRAVTVYRRGARVTRVAELARGPEGFPARIQLVGLPLTLDDGSARVELEVVGGGRAPIAGDLRVALAGPAEPPRLPAPSEVELDQAKLALAEIRAEIEVLEARLGRLAQLRPEPRGAAAEGEPPRPSPTAARLALLKFRRERGAALEQQQRDARERERLARERVTSLEERKRLASSQRQVRTYELRKAAILDLELPPAGASSDAGELAERVTIRLHYFVPGARWAPAYTLRLDRGLSGASLELRALVGQASGEDWRGVDLTLSTAMPQRWTELPKLDSRRIGRRQPTPAKTGWRPPPSGAEALYADYDRGLGGPSEGGEPEPAPEPAPEGFDLGAPMVESAMRTGGFVPQPPGPPPRPPSMPGGMPPAPPPAAAPMMARQAMPEMVRSAAKRRSMPAVLGAAAAAFGGSDDDDSFASDMPAAAAAAEPEPELHASEELLDYGRLRMFAAGDLRRGRLRRLSLRAAYQATSAGGVEVDAALARVEAALAQARALDQRPAPEGHRWAEGEGGYDYAYVADAPIELASDGRLRSILVASQAAEANPRYVAVPRETQDVFRIVRLRNPLAAPLLPGPADVYVAGKFALTTPVELTPIAGQLELGLGVEQAIKIARNVSYTEDSSGMFKRKLELRHTVAVEIANHLPATASVEIRERVPVPADHQADEIEIEVAGVTPAWEDWEPKDQQPALAGGHRWIVEVAAGQTRTLEATWIVRIPTQHELVGGNRREA